MNQASWYRYWALIISWAFYAFGLGAACAAMWPPLSWKGLIGWLFVCVAAAGVKGIDTVLKVVTGRELERFVVRSSMLLLLLVPCLPAIVAALKTEQDSSRFEVGACIAMYILVTVIVHIKEFESEWWKQRSSKIATDRADIPSAHRREGELTPILGNGAPHRSPAVRSALERLNDLEPVGFRVHHRSTSSNLSALPFFVAATLSAIYLGIHGVISKDWVLWWLIISTCLIILSLAYLWRLGVVLSPWEVKVTGFFKTRTLRWEDIDDIGVVCVAPTPIINIADKSGISDVYLNSNAHPERSVHISFPISDLGTIVDVVSVRTGVKPRYVGQKTDGKVGELALDTHLTCSICGEHRKPGRPFWITTSGKKLCGACNKGLQKLWWLRLILMVITYSFLATVVMGCFGQIPGLSITHTSAITTVVRVVCLVTAALGLLSPWVRMPYIFLLPLGLWLALWFSSTIEPVYAAVGTGMLIAGVGMCGLEIVHRLEKMANAYLEDAPLKR